MEQLHALAQAAGLQRDWIDVEGRHQQVSDAALAAALHALGHEASDERQIARSRVAIDDARRALPAMLVADCGVVTELPFAPSRAEVTGEDGVTRTLHISGNRITAPDAPGYYDLVLDDNITRLAAAPHNCPLPDQSQRRPWGVGVQIPALRGVRPSPYGTFGELAEAARAFGAAGADALAINPVHALFPGHGKHHSPYSPSSRLFLNGALADPALAGLAPLPTEPGGPLIDWGDVLPRRQAQLRAMFDALDPARRAAMTVTDDAMLRRHALFDALDCHFRAATGAHGWRGWPSEFNDPESEDAARFAAQNADEIAFHLFVQNLARTGLEAAQFAAKGAGMQIGLIGDLAVGVDPSGSDAWSLRHAMLDGLMIGAPPDPLGPLGQNWGITGFSPQGLAASGYAPWIAMIRAGLAAGGGLRIDHAFGLARLWVIPEGAETQDGAYLTYPFEDLIRLATLEAHRAGAVMIAEDLGTAPYGFTEAVTDRRMLGMRVLWFERAADQGFVGASDYEPLSAAMTGTHDTVTVAGWWRGRDLYWADYLARLPEGMTRDEADEVRDWDRGLLWSTLSHDPERPAPDNPEPVVDAAIAHIARAPSAIALVSLEDMLGLEEQPNLPGTIDTHPNWRRRCDAPITDLLAAAPVERRCGILSELRKN